MPGADAAFDDAGGADAGAAFARRTARIARNSNGTNAARRIDVQRLNHRPATPAND